MAEYVRFVDAGALCLISLQKSILLLVPLLVFLLFHILDGFQHFIHFFLRTKYIHLDVIDRSLLLVLVFGYLLANLRKFIVEVSLSCCYLIAEQLYLLLRIFDSLLENADAALPLIIDAIVRIDVLHV